MVVRSVRIFILRGNQAFIPIIGALLSGYLAMYYIFDTQLFLQPQVVPQGEMSVQIIKRSLFALSAYLIGNHHNQRVPHAHTHTHTHTHTSNYVRTGRYSM
jgi:hypothetical protein